MLLISKYNEIQEEDQRPEKASKNIMKIYVFVRFPQRFCRIGEEIMLPEWFTRMESKPAVSIPFGIFSPARSAGALCDL